MTVSSMRRVLLVLIVPTLLAGCVLNEVEVPPVQEELHQVIFHAGWDPETRTVLQEDGSVWWSPEDEISLFVSGKNGYNENNGGNGYKLTSTNTVPAANVNLIGEVNEQLSGASFFAIYPFNQCQFDGSHFTVLVRKRQEACEGSFNKGVFISAAVSDNDHLLFKNLCGGIKFSVANEGIDRIVIETMSDQEYISGQLYISPAMDLSWEAWWNRSNKLEVIAPDGGAFVPGSFYYAVLPAMKYSGLKISYYKGNEVATFKERSDVTIKRSTFKRLYNKDAELAFVKIPDKKALLSVPILPEWVDESSITEANFYVGSEIVTETTIGSATGGYEPIYFEQNGTVVNYYTRGEVYELSGSADRMFMGWNSLKRLDLSSFNTENVYSMGMMFYECRNLETLNISSFETEKCGFFSEMFGYCSSLKTLDLSHFDTSHTTGEYSLYAMFEECRNLRTLDITGWKPKSARFDRMFYRCINLAQVDVSGFDFSTTVSAREMFADCHVLSKIDADNWKSSTITDLNGMFRNCRSLTSLDISGLDFSNIDDMQGLFSGCQNLSELSLSNSRTASIKTWGVEGMFLNCQKLKSLDLSNFNTSGVTDMSSVFFQCYALESLDLSGWDTSNVSNMTRMFFGCSALQHINLSAFDTQNVTNMYEIFSGCSNLRSLDLSNWTTPQVTDLSYAFQGCNKLERLDISGFRSDNLQNVTYMFGYTYKLSAINMGDFDLSPVSSQPVLYNTAIHTPNCYIRCIQDTKGVIEQNTPNFTNVIWITDGSNLPDNISSTDESIYHSTDYSMDRVVRTVQRASAGAGIDLVLMGDGYSDRLIASGDYDQDMERTIDCIFKYEPFKSFKSLFNIYIIYAVSENEHIGKSTALDTYDTRDPVFGGIGSNDIQSIYSYSMNASGKGDRREIATVVVLNSEISDGAVRHSIMTSADGEVFDYHNDLNWDDYHGSENIAFVSGPSQGNYEGVVIHEFGHAFGNLADEYWSDDNNQISQNERDNLLNLFPYGMWKNIDVTDDPSSIKWSYFLSDSRYSNSGTGIFEGGDTYYGKGVWRPSENSIMRYDTTGQFNAPSREAIYYRIHKLAFGKDWEYNFEDFVQWDLKNIQPVSNAPLKLAPHLQNRKPYFKREESTAADGRKMITIIMN